MAKGTERWKQRKNPSILYHHPLPQTCELFPLMANGYLWDAEFSSHREGRGGGGGAQGRRDGNAPRGNRTGLGGNEVWRMGALGAGSGWGAIGIGEH